MRPLLRLKSCLSGLLALAMMACGEAATPDYPGEPVASVHGQLTAESSAAIDGPVRLALGWYPLTPDSGLVSSKPKTLVTQELEYTGSFPINYTFDLFGPPPADALNNLPQADGTPNKVAMGMILAYRDGNGNGKLDTIPANGTGVDRVLGVSLDFSYFDLNRGMSGFYLLYSDVARPADPDYGPALQPGYSLVRIVDRTVEPESESGPVPLTTPVPIALTGKPELALHVCDQLYTSGVVVEPDPNGGAPTLCGVELSLPPLPGESDGDELNLNFSLQDGVASILVTVQRLGEPDEEGMQYPVEVTDAQVSINGVTFTYDGQQHSYQPTAPFSFTLGAAVTVSLTSGGTARSYEMTLPSDFSITSPTAGAELQSGAPVSVTWASAWQGWSFSGTIHDEDGMPIGSGFDDGGTLTITPDAYVGAGDLRVSGWSYTRTMQGDNVGTYVTHTVPVTFVE